VSSGVSLRRDGQEAFAMRTFVQQGADGAAAIGSDHVDVDCHGFVNTHIDALNHMGFEGTWYGGRPIGDDVPEEPSVLDLATGGIFTRALHIDIPALRGDPWVRPGQPVTAEEIDGALAAAGEVFQPGDALLLDMGRDRLEASGASLSDPGPRPGAGWSAAEWIADHDVSVLCWDMLDASGTGEPRGPVHRLTWALGLILVDNCDFSACRPLLARAGRQRAALAIGPLAFAGATGCLVNPLAIV
jgi:kynurenine formamidase